ncbi:hypothetical protein SNEBB_007028 [Seison nebaliae]|nr:hypothetical protein SNEBB_007028 [Seison nebaliae]
MMTESCDIYRITKCPSKPNFDKTTNGLHQEFNELFCDKTRAYVYCVNKRLRECRHSIHYKSAIITIKTSLQHFLVSIRPAQCINVYDDIYIPNNRTSKRTKEKKIEKKMKVEKKEIVRKVDGIYDECIKFRRKFIENCDDTYQMDNYEKFIKKHFPCEQIGRRSEKNTCKSFVDQKQKEQNRLFLIRRMRNEQLKAKKNGSANFIPYINICICLILLRGLEEESR